MNGVVRDGGAATFDVDAAMANRTATLIRSVKAMSGGAANAPILDGRALSESLSAAPGVSAARLSNTGQDAIKGTVNVQRLGDFLRTGSSELDFISWSESGGQARLSIQLSRANAPTVLSRVSADAVAYLEALMAPVVTGERQSRAEYLALVGSIYGQGVAQEISAARIQLAFELPRPAARVRGGTAQGRRVSFDIPLTDILVLERPLSYEAAW
jgi:hypothetical protein